LAFRAKILGARRVRVDQVGRLSVGKRAVGAGHGQPFGPVRGRFQGGQHRGGRVDIHGAGPGVAAGHFQRGMPHQLLDDPGRHPRGVGQRRQLAPKGVEVEHLPGRVAVGDAGRRQVDPEHLGAPAAAR
jgi:hypothetical protein